MVLAVDELTIRAAAEMPRKVTVDGLTFRSGIRPGKVLLSTGWLQAVPEIPKIQ